MQLQKDIANGTADTPDKIEFARSVIAVYEGAKIYAGYLAEAITVVWICYHLLLQENTNFGLSLGRLS